MSTEWVILSTFQSESSQDKSYRVKLNIRTGIIGCDCPVWVYKKNGRDVRWCKHTAQTAKLLTCRPQKIVKDRAGSTQMELLIKGDVR